jgi:hypothetical protein
MWYIHTMGCIKLYKEWNSIQCDKYGTGHDYIWTRRLSQARL